MCLFSGNIGRLIRTVIFLNLNTQPEMRHPAACEYDRQLSELIVAVAADNADSVDDAAR